VLLLGGFNRVLHFGRVSWPHFTALDFFSLVLVWNFRLMGDSGEGVAFTFAIYLLEVRLRPELNP